MISCLNVVLMVFLLIPIYTQDFIVSLKNGKIQGTTVSSIEGREIFSFYKIPYAKPPVGKRRFEVSKIALIDCLFFQLIQYSDC